MVSGVHKLLLSLEDKRHVHLTFCSIDSTELVCTQSLSRVRFFATPRTVADWAPLSMEFLRQEYWSGLPFSPSGDLFNSGTESESPASPVLQADSLPLGKPSVIISYLIIVNNKLLEFKDFVVLCFAILLALGIVSGTQ